jgi:hypothetical protein
VAAGSIVIDLLMRTGAFETDTKRAEKALAKVKKEADALASTLISGLAVAFTAATAAAIYYGKTQLDLIDKTADLAEKTGLTTEEFSSLAYAARFADISQDELAGTLVKLNKSISDAARGTGDAANGLATLGISAKNADDSLRSADDVLVDVAGRFSKMRDSAEKTALAVSIFGKSGADLIPLLNRGADGISELRQEAERLGVVVGTDAAQAAGQLNDNLDRLRAAAEGSGRAILAELLPSLVKFSEETLVGIKNANGLFDAIATFGTINPFRTQAENIKAYSEELAKTKAAREDFAARGLSTAAYDRDIEDLTKKLKYLRELQAGEALATGEGAQSAAETARLGMGGGKVNAPRIIDPVQIAKDAKASNEAWVKMIDQMIEAERNAALELGALADEDRKMREDARAIELKQVIENIDAESQAYEESLRDRAMAIDELNKKARQFGDSLSISFVSAFEEAIRGGRSLGDIFDSLLQDVIQLVARMLILQPLLDSIKSSISRASAGGGIASLFGFATGGVMTSNGPMPLSAYASGGVASSPQLALFGEGSMNEAFVPLPDGRSIPVTLQGGGGGGTSVVINNYTGEKVSQREVPDGRGGRRLEVQIGDAVASEMSRPGSSVRSAMRSNFGSQPALVGR